MKKVFQGEIFSIWQWEQEMFDGSMRTYEKAARTNGGRVIGVMPDKRILLVEDDQPDRGIAFGPAGGQLEEGETPEEGAKREFFEETGYEAETLIPFYINAAGFRVDVQVDVFIGKGLIKKGEPQQSAGEKITIRFFTFDEFLALGSDERLRDLNLRIILLEAQLDPKKKEELYQLLYG